MAETITSQAETNGGHGGRVLNRFVGRSALIVGSSQGVGLATAKAIAQEGGNVTITSREAERAQDAADRINRGLGRTAAIGCQLDILKPDSISSAIDTAVQNFDGRLDIYHHNAGPAAETLWRAAGIATTPSEVDKEIWEANFHSFEHGARTVLPIMEQQGGGVIAYTSSAASFAPQGFGDVYGNSKAAAERMIESIAVEYGPKGISAFGVAPGPVQTEYLDQTLPEPIRSQYMRHVPIQHMSKPEEVAEVFTLGMSLPQISGQTVHLDGGLSAASPWTADFRSFRDQAAQ